ncbi:hypothetical protein DH2020_012507 [Rehmannia glutinosa]|uniref:Protein kinase domain-containing protein n=1 Tax=Rehmannia glutinosa TaxID=99300 RepID=A0ABR0X0V9_REHGL
MAAVEADDGSEELDLDRLYEIAVSVAKGLEYLHTGCNTRIVHFDIKPQNILLDEDFCLKISDFGLAKLCKKKQSLLSVIGMSGTIGYIAPKMFSRNFGVVLHKLDVYSYGMMVLEMDGANKFTNPSDRPWISKVVEMLEGRLQSIQIPPKPVLFVPNTLPVLEFSSSFSSYDETEPSAEEIIWSQGVSVNVKKKK